MSKQGVQRFCATTGLAVMLAGGFLSGPAAAEPPSPKLLKQIGVMERILDGVLVDSPNFLVYSQKNTHGVYLDEFGVLFCFEASLIDKNQDNDWLKQLGKKFKIYTGKDGQTIIDLGDDKDEDKDNDNGKEPTPFNGNEWKERHERAQKELYENGKAELVEALSEYGETLGGLRANQSVGVTALLRDNDFLTDNKISTLVLKAKVSDLRAYAAGNISEKEMRSRVVVEEY